MEREPVDHIIEGGLFQEETFELRLEETRKSQAHLRWRNTTDTEDKHRDANRGTALVSSEWQEAGGGWGRRKKAGEGVSDFQNWARPVLVGTVCEVTGHGSLDWRWHEGRKRGCSVGHYFYSHGKCPLKNQGSIYSKLNSAVGDEDIKRTWVISILLRFLTQLGSSGVRSLERLRILESFWGLAFYKFYLLHKWSGGNDLANTLRDSSTLTGAFIIILWSKLVEN